LIFGGALAGRDQLSSSLAFREMVRIQTRSLGFSLSSILLAKETHPPFSPVGHFS
jgi:hypothetical protein